MKNDRNGGNDDKPDFSAKSEAMEVQELKILRKKLDRAT